MNWNERGILWILPAAALLCLQRQFHVRAAANSTATAAPVQLSANGVT